MNEKTQGLSSKLGHYLTCQINSKTFLVECQITKVKNNFIIKFNKKTSNKFTLA